MLQLTQRHDPDIMTTVTVLSRNNKHPRTSNDVLHLSCIKMYGQNLINVTYHLHNKRFLRSLGTFLYQVFNAAVVLCLNIKPVSSCNQDSEIHSSLDVLNSPQSPDILVFFAAVFRLVTQRSSPQRRGALRDEPKNGCEGDYRYSLSSKIHPYLQLLFLSRFPSNRRFFRRDHRVSLFFAW